MSTTPSDEFKACRLLPDDLILARFIRNRTVQTKGMTRNQTSFRKVKYIPWVRLIYSWKCEL